MRSLKFVLSFDQRVKNGIDFRAMFPVSFDEFQFILRKLISWDMFREVDIPNVTEFFGHLASVKDKIRSNCSSSWEQNKGSNMSYNSTQYI
jgi:hypothetical protein